MLVLDCKVQRRQHGKERTASHDNKQRERDREREKGEEGVPAPRGAEREGTPAVSQSSLGATLASIGQPAAQGPERQREKRERANSPAISQQAKPDSQPAGTMLQACGPEEGSAGGRRSASLSAHGARRPWAATVVAVRRPAIFITGQQQRPSTLSAHEARQHHRDSGQRQRRRGSRKSVGEYSLQPGYGHGSR